MKKFELCILRSALFLGIIFICNASTAQTAARTSFRYTPVEASEPRPLDFSAAVFRDKEDEKFILAIDNPSAEKLVIRLVGQGGQRFTKLTKENSFRTRFDMSQAEDGEYTITVIGRNKTYTKKFNLRTNMEISRNVNFSR